MNYKKLLLLCCLAVVTLFTSAQKKQAPVNIIFDTDMGPDYDDVGAITILHAFADSGKANILATMASTRFEGVAAVLDALNTYFKRPDLPIGVPKGEAVDKKDWQHWTDSVIAHYPRSINTNDEAPDAVGLYRKLLAQQADNSVTIVTVGFLTNIKNLLQSKPDSYSKLTGKELVNKKVKQLVSMAGKFPEGKEFNVYMDAPASAFVYENFEKPVIFSGFEIGAKIKAGLPLIHNDAIQNSPVKDVFRIAIPMAAEDSLGRMSWDETAVLVAIAGYEPWYTLQEGKIVIAKDGSNTWNNKGKNQFYLKEAQPHSEVEKVINNLIMHQPK